MVRPSHFRTSIPSRQGQLGVAAIYAAASLIAGTSAMALAIDIGQLYYAQRDLQKLASSAAVDTARAFSGCYTTSGATAGAPGTPAAVKIALDASIASNLPNRLNGDFASVNEVEQAYGNGINTLEFGMMGRRVINGVPTRAFVNLGATSPSVDSVQVNLARQAPTPLLGFVFSGPTGAPITLRGSAAAQQSPVASYSLTTTLASVSTPTPLGSICRLTGGTPAICASLPSIPLTVTAVGSGGLAGATLTLNQLATTLGVGSAGNLLTTTIATNVLLQGIANTLTGSVNGAGSAVQGGAAAALNQLAAAAGTAQVTVGQLVGVIPGAADQVGNLPIDASALLTQLGIAASHGLYPINLGVPINIPGVKVDTFLTLGATPGTAPSASDDEQNTSRLGLGRSGMDASGNPRTSASIQQLNLQVRIGISSGSLPALGALLGSAATVNIGIDVAGATATSSLASINCPAPLGGSSVAKLKIPATFNAANVAIGTFNPAAETAAVTGGNAVALVGGLVTIGLPPPTPISLGAGSAMLEFQPPFPNSQTVGLTSATLQTALNSLYGPLGSGITVKTVGLAIPVSGAVVVAALKPVLDQVAGLLDPVIGSLGVGLGGATVTAQMIDFGTHAGDTFVATSTNSAPVLFNKTRPFFDGDPVQTVGNGPSTR